MVSGEGRGKDGKMMRMRMRTRTNRKEVKGRSGELKIRVLENFHCLKYRLEAHQYSTHRRTIISDSRDLIYHTYRPCRQDLVMVISIYFEAVIRRKRIRLEGHSGSRIHLT
jgi:hypothetical protein